MEGEVEEVGVPVLAARHSLSQGRNTETFSYIKVIPTYTPL